MPFFANAAATSLGEPFYFASACRIADVLETVFAFDLAIICPEGL